jgi:hypothetical protein
MTIISADIEAPSGDGFDFSANNQILIVKANVILASDQADGVFAFGFSQNDIYNQGMILSSDSSAGVSFDDANGFVDDEAGGVMSGGTGLLVGDSPVNVVNDGQINGENYGVTDGFVGLTLTNSGTIEGGVNGVSDTEVNEKIHNSGKIIGNTAAALALGSHSVVTNSRDGAIDGGITLAAGSDTITNAGGIDGAVAFTGAGITNSVTNSGEITGNIKFSSAHSTLTNSGSMTGDVTMVGTDTLINTGVIHGDVTLGVSDIIELSVGQVTGAIAGKTNDLFAFSGNFGNETIDKFIGGTGPTHDTIRFAANDFGSFATVKNHMSQVGADVVIRLDGTDSITLDRIKLSSLVAADFKFV